MALSDTRIRGARKSDTQVKLFDGGGLFLLVTPSGGKLWQLKYRHEGKESHGIDVRGDTFFAVGHKFTS